MRIIRVLVAVLALLIVGYLILCSTGGDSTNLESEIIIEAPSYSVYEQIGDLNNWNNWLPWVESDNMQIEVGPISRGKGASYTWSSNRGNGTFEILETIPNVSLRTSAKPEKSDYDYRGFWNLVPNGNETKLMWKMDSDEKISFIKKGFFNYVAKPRMNSSMNEGLSKIKELAESAKDEKRIAYGDFVIEEGFVEPKNYLIIRAVDDYDNYSSFYDLTMKTLSERIEEQTLQTTGSPTIFIFNWDRQSNKIDLASAREVSGFEGKEGLNMFPFPGGNIVYTEYMGPFVNPLDAHVAIGNYVSDNGLNVIMPCFFEYMITSEDTSDSRKWKTRLSYITFPDLNQ